MPLPTPAEAAREILRRDDAREHIEHLVSYLDMGWTMAKHQLFLASKLESLERGEINNLLVMCPPGSAKSSYCSVIFPAWFLGRNPKKSVISASHTVELAERFGRRARNIVGSPLFSNVFPSVGLAKDSQSAGRWETSQGGEYFAAGVGGSVTGRRADVGVIDDPVKSREDADSLTIREKQWEWYVNDFLTRLKPGAKQLLVMTRWHEDDLAGRILEREADKWEIINLPMIAGENDIIGRQPGELLWSEWFTPDMIARAKSDLRSWYALYQQEPRPMGGGEFKREWVQYYGSSVDHYSMARVILVDPASSKKKTSDYSAYWVVGIGDDGNFYILDAIRDRLNLTERGDMLFKLHKKWRPQQVRYEKYGMMADIEYIRGEQERRSYRFKITEVGGATSKEDRVRRLVPLFQNGMVWFPNSMFYTDSTGASSDLIRDFVEQELLSFPVGKHDDMLDSLARIAEPDLVLPAPVIHDFQMPKFEKFTPFVSSMGY